MIEGLLALVTSPAGVIGAVCLVLLVVFALDRNYTLARPISDNITKIGEPNTDRLLRALFAIGGFASGLYIVLSQSYSESVEKWAMTLIGTIVGAFIGSAGKR